jgi:hypothetical protein
LFFREDFDMSLPSYKINNSYTVYVNYHYLNDCIQAGKKAAAQKKKQQEEYKKFIEIYCSNTVKAGSKVTLLDLDTGLQSNLTILPSLSFVPGANTVSSASPVGRALLGRSLGDTVTIQIPNGTIRYRIQNF